MEAHLVVFALANDKFGIDLHRVQSITPTLLLHTADEPAQIVSQIRLHDVWVSVIDLRRLFGVPEAPGPHRHTIISVSAGETSVGLAVDRVIDVCKCSNAAISLNVSTGAHIDASYVQAIARRDDRIIHLLNLEHILECHAETRLHQAA